MDTEVVKSSSPSTLENGNSMSKAFISNGAANGDPLPYHNKNSNNGILDTNSTLATPAAGESNLVERTEVEQDKEGQVTSCGWLCYTPAYLQRCRTAKWVLFWLCAASTVQGMVITGFTNSVITNIEKRFDLRSTDTGIIAGAYDIASVFCVIPVSYFGSRPTASKPRWVGWGMFVLGIGSFCFAAPHFLAPYYNPSGSEASFKKILVCLKDADYTERCAGNAKNWISNYQVVFIIAQLIHGIGASPLYTLGTTFLDGSVPMKMSSIYLGIFYAMGAVGPALGFVLGSLFLKIYIDAPLVDSIDLDISPSSDLWLGGWWIGFLLSGSLSIILSVPIMAFPNKLPDHKKIEASRVSEVHSGIESSNSGTSFGKLRDFPQSARILLTNPTFMGLSLGMACKYIIISGLSTFTPKFLETQFQVPAARASVLIGITVVPAAGGGVVFGGWIVKRLKLTIDGIMKLVILLSALCFILCFTFTFSCPNPQFAGVNIAYDNRPITSVGSSNLVDSCNSNCSCNGLPYEPVCGSNGVKYFTPCHAGCTTLNNQTKAYSNCACLTSVPIDSISTNVSRKNGTVMHDNFDNCKVNCPHLTIFLIMFFIIMLITFITALPALTATLRCIPDEQKSLGLGLQWIIVRLLGTIPGPMIFGSLIDNTCTLWQDTCGIIGSCRIYDNPSMSKYMLGIVLFGKLLSTILFIFAWKLYIPPGNKTVPSMASEEITTASTSINDQSTIAKTNNLETSESSEDLNKDNGVVS